MGEHGNDDLAAGHGLSPADAALVRVDRLDALPGALMQWPGGSPEAGTCARTRSAGSPPSTRALFSPCPTCWPAGTRSAALLHPRCSVCPASCAPTPPRWPPCVPRSAGYGRSEMTTRALLSSFVSFVAGCVARTAGWLAGAPTTTSTLWCPLCGPRCGSPLPSVVRSAASSTPRRGSTHRGTGRGNKRRPGRCRGWSTLLWWRGSRDCGS